MRYEVDECCGCAVPGYPCIGELCSMRHQIRFQCDRCGVDDLTEDEIYELDGEDLCFTCYDEEFDDKEED